MPDLIALDIDRPSGCLERTTRFGDEYRVFEEHIRLIPRSDWAARVNSMPDMASLVKKIKDQGQEGSCASNATAQAFEVGWNLALGAARWIETSPISIYHWIAGGPDTGSTIDDNIRQLANVGILPAKTDRNRQLMQTYGLPVEHLHPARGYYAPFPPGWKQTAAFFRALEWFDIGSFDGLISALLLGMPTVYGRAGHAICGIRPVHDGGAWYVKYANSWTPNWGDHGFGHDSERFIASAIKSYGAWALRAPHLDDRFFKPAPSIPA